MNAKTYNEIRRIIFATANNPQRGFCVAAEWLEKTYKPKLDPRSYAGLKAELKFYEKHRRDFFLTVAGDMGEHADFAGNYEGIPTRFDVTTNVKFKKFRDYEPYVGDGIRYQIALLDKKSFEIIDVFDLAFDRCTCGGHLIPFITMLGGNYNRHGDPLWHNDQAELNICSACHQFVEVDRFYNQVRFSPQEYYNDLLDIDDNDERNRLYNEYCVDNYKYFRSTHQENLMGIATPTYINAGYKGEDGYWALGFSFLNSAIKEDFSAPIQTNGPFE